MYVILVYDFGEKRVSKMLRLCRRYLNWIQKIALLFLKGLLNALWKRK